MIRAPDDPGVDQDGAGFDQVAEQIGPPKAQAGGWRGFLSRWGQSSWVFDVPRFSCQSETSLITDDSVTVSGRTLRLVRRNSSVGRARHS